MSAPDAAPRFRDRAITFANGSHGVHFEVESAMPANFHQAIGAPGAMARLTLDAKLFRPAGAPAGAELPVVVLVAGSLGVTPSTLEHAETLTGMGIAAFVIDPFGARTVTSTVANQTQYSFAASAYDALAALKTVTRIPGVDPARIGAQGHSRGGSAVLSAAMERLARPVLGPGPRFRAVYSVYPWCGQQFLDPDIGHTELRIIIGDRDGWCLPQQAQGYAQAIRLRGGKVSFRLVGDAEHGFDGDGSRDGGGLETLPDAMVAPGAPTIYVADDGAFIHPISGEADPALLDFDLMVYAMKAGYGVRGAKLGCKPGQHDLFRDDMTAFWRGAFGL